MEYKKETLTEQLEQLLEDQQLVLERINTNIAKRKADKELAIMISLLLEEQ